MNKNIDTAAIEAQDAYSAISGAGVAAYDIANGQPGYHRDASNSPAYRDAYDSIIHANGSK